MKLLRSKDKGSNSGADLSDVDVLVKAGAKSDSDSLAVELSRKLVYLNLVIEMERDQ